MKTISIIIPAFNEARNIESLIRYLWKNSSGFVSEIIVADGGSGDGTKDIAETAGAKVITSPKGRAVQMNMGGKMASTEILYFLHADTFPPPGFDLHIVQAVKNHFTSGCFRIRFEPRHFFLDINAWFTRFNIDSFRYGDQSFFILRNKFHEINGYNENLRLFEDQDIVIRSKEVGSFKVLPFPVISSSRKYLSNGVFRLQCLYYFLFFLYRAGVKQERIVRIYRKFIKDPRC